MSAYSRERLEKELNTNIPETKSKELIIWGIGNTAQLYQEGLTRLSVEGFHITAYCDNNVDESGKEFCGKPVISPEKLSEYQNVCVLICTPNPLYIHEISVQLEKINIPYYLLDEVILKQHAVNVLECYDLLEDDESKRVYADVVLSHINGRTPCLENRIYGEQYFLHSYFQTTLTPEEVFIDCGSYVGDTLEKYIWNRDGVFKKIIAFEPDRDNYKAMGTRVDRLRKEWNLKEDAIEIFPYGVADKNRNGIFGSYETNNGLGSKFVEGEPDNERAVKIISLDEYLSEPYTFLKADIESYEYKMLLGAEQGIKKWKPLIAVCIYHNAVDLYSIPLLIKSMVKEYQMAVRHHSGTLADTILYCWCP